MQGFLATSRARAFRRAGSFLGVWALTLQTACYSYAPLQTATPQPKQMGVVINDRGRTLLGERVGELVDRIDGQVISIDSQTVVIDVFRVTDLRGNGSTWTGERVNIPREGVLGFRERKLSTIKVLALVGVAAVAIAALLSTSLDVFGDPKTDPPPEPPVISTRIPR